MKLCIHFWVVMVFLAAPLSAQDTNSFKSGGSGTGLWKSSGPLRTYVGDSLFDFIDGGAAIYQEYGFRQVVATQYTDWHNRRFNAEAYEMSDPAAAFGIFSFQRGDNAEPVAVGDSGVAGSYYVSFWKDRYLVMITAQDSSRETRLAMLKLAQQLDSHMAQHGRPPLLARALDPQATGCTRLVYVRGYLGLVNQYDFGPSDPFGTGEGVVITCNDAILVALLFGNEQKATEAYDAARPILERAPRFSSFDTTANRVHCLDRDGNHVVLTKHGRYLLAAIAQDRGKAERALQRASSLL